MNYDALMKELGRLNPTAIKLHRWLKDDVVSANPRNGDKIRRAEAMCPDKPLVLGWNPSTLSLSEGPTLQRVLPRSPTVTSSCNLQTSMTQPPFSLDDGFAGVLKGKPNIVEARPGYTVLFC
jgi:hypothetical protein